MNKDEALRLALKTLEYAGPSWIEARQPAITAIKEALANEALDKMAENARELGLDYEPAQRTWVGLTDIDYAGLPLEQVGLVRWAEAKLKAKNT
jgi:hypothetical protein